MGQKSSSTRSQFLEVGPDWKTVARRQRLVLFKEPDGYLLSGSFFLLYAPPSPASSPIPFEAESKVVKPSSTTQSATRRSDGGGGGGGDVVEDAAAAAGGENAPKYFLLRKCSSEPAAHAALGCLTLYSTLSSLSGVNLVRILQLVEQNSSLPPLTILLRSKCGEVSLREALRSSSSSSPSSSSPFSPFAVDHLGNTPLHACAALLSRDAVTGQSLDIFVECAPRTLHTRNHAGETPLHVAACAGNVSAIVHLVAAGADREAADGNGAMALHRAVLSDHVDAMKLLIELGANVSATCQHAHRVGSCSSNNSNSVPRSSSSGARGPSTTSGGGSSSSSSSSSSSGGSNAMSLHSGSSSSRCGLIHLAVDSAMCMRVLLEEKICSVAALTDRQESALHFAARSDNVRAGKLLLQHFVDPLIQTHDGSTALHYAAAANSASAGLLLLSQVNFLERSALLCLFLSFFESFLSLSLLLLFSCLFFRPPFCFSCVHASICLF